MSETCDDFIRGHVIEVCRDRCAEISVDGTSFKACIEDCMRELKKLCGQG